MKTQRFVYVLAAALLGLAALACADTAAEQGSQATPEPTQSMAAIVSTAEATATQAPAATATATTAPPAPTATQPPAAPTATATSPAATLANTLLLDRQDDGRTFEVNVGERLAVSLDTKMSWTLDLSNPSVLEPDTGAARLGAGVIALYKAAKPGQTRIDATGVIKCAPGEACPQIAAIVSFFITVP